MHVQAVVFHTYQYMTTESEWLATWVWGSQECQDSLQCTQLTSFLQAEPTTCQTYIHLYTRHPVTVFLDQPHVAAFTKSFEE